MSVNAAPIRIAGTTALVTGASRGIGRALVEALVARGAAKVYATARTPEALADLVAAGRGRVVALQLDVTRPDQIRAAAAAAQDVGLLVNNAGVLAKVDGALRIPQAEFTPDRLAAEISAFAAEPARLTAMAEAARQVGRLDAAERPDAGPAPSSPLPQPGSENSGCKAGTTKPVASAASSQ